uniref:Uncharacterized protein n=1 Tax=Hyaloperonospora arabidopsidis (strain Emoy2) TaxID=559515 RepID=M4BF83_HYAAE
MACSTPYLQAGPRACCARSHHLWAQTAQGRCKRVFVSSAAANSFRLVRYSYFSFFNHLIDYLESILSF